MTSDRRSYIDMAAPIIERCTRCDAPLDHERMCWDCYHGWIVEKREVEIRASLSKQEAQR